MFVRRTIENAVAAVAAIGGIFGLIVDAPGVWETVGGWFRAMLSRDAGYWLLIVSGLLSLAWINLGDRIKRRFADSAKAEEPTAELPSAIKDEIVRLWKSIEGVSDFASELSKTSSETQRLNTEIRILRDVEPRLAHVENELTRINDRLSQLQRNYSHLARYCIDNAMYQVLAAVREHEPKEIVAYHGQSDITEQWIEEQTEIMRGYLSHVLENLVSTKWFDELLAIVQQSQTEGSEYVASMPADKRPQNVDPYKFREYGIARIQYEHVASFLMRLQHQNNTEMANYLADLQGQPRNHAE